MNNAIDKSYSINYETPENILDEILFIIEFCESMADGTRDTNAINHIYRVDCLKYADIAVELYKALQQLQLKGLTPPPPPEVTIYRKPKPRRKPHL